MPHKNTPSRILATLAGLTLSVMSFSSLAMAQTLYPTPNGCESPFYDSQGSPYANEICFLYNQGVVEGHSTRNFLPEHTITRAEFLKIATLTLGHNVNSVQSQAFTDTKPGEWYFRYVTFAREKGWVQGYLDGSFKPNQPITRAEAIVLLMNMSGIIGTNPEALTGFYDVSESDWFGLQVSIAHEKGFLTLFDDYLHPHEYIKRGESAFVATRLWEELY